jgi:predicted AlkP superfamily pyrophosphatase or phosphodiesterase
LVNLPLKYWPLFTLSDNVMWDDPKWKQDLPNLFTILEGKGIKKRIVALHRGTRADDAFREESQVDYRNDEFVYYFIGYTDNTMHSYGEQAPEAAEYLAQVDAFIRKTVEKAKSIREDVTVLAFSDHGHIDLRKPYIDINDYFKG